MYFFINLFICFLLGGIYSFGELLAKFKNATYIFNNRWGVLYLLFNGLLSVLAYLILKDFDFMVDEYKKIDGGKVLMAGISSMVIIRSWIISVPISNNKEKKSKKEGVTEGSLAPLIQIFLNYVEKEFDVQKANSDYQTVDEIMKGVDFEKAAFALPITLSNLLVTFTKEDGVQIAKTINELAKKSLDEQSKLLNLGLILKEYVGFDLLKTVVEDFRAKIKEEPMGTSPQDELIKLLKEFDV